MRKLLLLASFALAAMAIAMPAAAQAKAPVFHGHEHFEGKLSFTVLAGPAAGSTFGCQVTVTVSGNTTSVATVETFEPTTETCSGTGAFAGCELVEDEANVHYHLTAATDHSLTVTKTGGDITIKNTYSGCLSGITGSHLEFGSVAVTANVTEGPLSTLTIKGKTTNSAVEAHGTLHAETGAGLTLTT